MPQSIKSTSLLVAHPSAVRDSIYQYPGGGFCQIEWPPEGKVRMRKVVRRSNARMTIKHPSWKAGRMMECESLLERHACVLHDVDPHVFSYKEQPARLRFMMDGVWYEHTPDILAQTYSGPIFREIKPKTATEDPFVIARTSFLERALPQTGYRYELLLEPEIVRQPRLRNAEFVLRFGRFSANVIQLEYIRKILSERPVTWGDARNGALGEKGLQVLCRLILMGDVPVAYDLEWVDDAPVLSGGGYV